MSIPNVFDVEALIRAGGLVLIGVIVYAEVGLFLGFFLPGDTLLIAAGIYAHAGQLPLAGVILVTILSAIAGDNTAYFLGKRLGPSVFRKPDGLVFRKDHILTSEKFFEKYGAKLLLVSHFLPVVRTFTPLLAGVGRMPYKRFAIFDAAGDVLWGVSVPLIGYYVGSRIPGIDRYILAIVLAAVVITTAPTLLHAAKLQLRRKRSTSAAQDADDR